MVPPCACPACRRLFRMSITIGDLAFELRLSGDPDTAPAPGIVATLARRRAHIAKRIELYAPTAPDEAKIEAAIRYIGYSFDTPTASAGTAFADAFRNSGAMIELADWHIPFALSLDAVAGIAAAAVPDTGLTPSHPVHTGTHNRYVGWSDDVVIAAADLQNAAVFTSDVLTIPARVANGYLWFAVDDDVGYPDSLIISTNQVTNQISFYEERANPINFGGHRLRCRHQPEPAQSRSPWRGNYDARVRIAMTTLRFNGPIAFDTADGRGVPVEVLDGARFVSIAATSDGNVEFVYLDSGNVERTFLIEIVQESTGLNLEQVQDAVAAMAVEGDNVTITYDDVTGQLTIASTGGGGGGGDGTDQVARDAAEAAQDEIDAHEAATHNTDPVARNRATTARNEAATAQTTIDTHEVGHPTQRVLNQDPNADADTLGKVQIDPQGNAYTTEPDTEHGTAQDADFARFTYAGYIGELSGEPNPRAQALGARYFLTTDHKLQVIASNAFGQNEWRDDDWVNILVAGARYRGARSGDTAALSHIRQDGDVYFDEGSNHIRIASNFVAGVTEHTSYASKRLARIEEVPEIDPLFVERSTLPARYRYVAGPGVPLPRAFSRR